MRSALLGYIYDFKEVGKESEEDKTFEGFQKQAMSPSMLDELDAFNL